MDEDTKLDVENDATDTQVYELGYHLLGNMTDEEVSDEVSKIHALIEKNKGKVISEGLPELVDLSYEIAKRIETKNLRFNKAFFGWVKFEVEIAKILDVKSKMETAEKVLRFLLIKTVKENTMYTPKIAVFKKDVAKDDKEEIVSDVVVEKTPVSEALIDKSIDELLVNEKSELEARPTESFGRVEK